MCISLRPSTYVMGSKVNLGSFGVTGVKRSFSPKMLLLQITWHGYVTHAYVYISLRPSIPFMGSRSTWGHIRQQTHATVSRSVLSFFTQSQSTVYFFCSFFFFFFCQHFKVLYLRHDLTDFDQTWSQVPVDHPIYVT